MPLKNSFFPTVSLFCTYRNPQYEKAVPLAQNKYMTLQIRLTSTRNFSMSQSMQNKVSSKNHANKQQNHPSNIEWSYYKLHFWICRYGIGKSRQKSFDWLVH